ncbi:Formin-like protein 8 [Citrus sinensis]|uniref:Formin-like protein 8 n=1 Tax=Citrus sinensis TaxID=2711 RepID=A0ACB8LSE2_CITSI|nr:Formin-like protein 8 [Citrus sinensis]
MGYKELPTRVIFLKLLEAILKAGNKINAGTSRGNAQRFNLSALRKLSNVKSTDGKTTLLHFVVEQVIRSKGRRGELNGNHILGRTFSKRSKTGDSNSKSSTLKERDNKYLKQRLPAVEGLSNEFTNEMKGLLEECEEELKLVRNEQNRTMELVKGTTKYYQGGVCADISRNLQKKNETTSVSSSPPLSPPSRSPVKFINLPKQLMSDIRAAAYSSESYDSF